MLHATRWNYRMQKTGKNSPSGHHHTNLSRYIFATKAHIDNRKKNLLNSNISSTRSHDMANFGLLAAEIALPVWGTPANVNGFRAFGSVTARHSSGRQRNFAALNRGHYLYSAGSPSPWALAHILVLTRITFVVADEQRNAPCGL